MPPTNTPFHDLVVLAVDSPGEWQQKLNFCISQGYQVWGRPKRFEDVLVDLQAADRPFSELPMKGAVVALLTRADPT